MKVKIEYDDGNVIWREAIRINLTPSRVEIVDELGTKEISFGDHEPEKVVIDGDVVVHKSKD